jgi:hypothetical protein
VAVVDINGDGQLDLVTSNYSGFNVSVLLGKGNGTFQAAKNYFGGPRPEAVLAADFNGDGLPDLAVRELFGAGVSVLLNKPNTATHFQITAPASVTAGTPFTITVTALTAGGQVDDLYTGTVHFTSSDDAAVLPADYKFSKRDLGVHTFTVTLKSAGTQTITATDKSHKTITGTASVTVNSMAPAPSRAGGRSSGAADDSPDLTGDGRAAALAAALAEAPILAGAPIAPRLGETANPPGNTPLSVADPTTGTLVPRLRAHGAANPRTAPVLSQERSLAVLGLRQADLVAFFAAESW